MQAGPEKYLGRHIIAEFFQADFDALNECDKLEEAMCNAALAAGATILSSHKHFFTPHGVSAVVIIQESNLCIHTWPEFGYAAADFFTCGDTVNPWKSFEFLKEFLKAKKFNAMELQRGSTDLINNSKMLQDTVTHEKLDGDQSIVVTEEETHTDTKVCIKTTGAPMVNKMSKFQKVVIAKNKWWGNILWLDDVVNVTERDEFIYHEMIVHVPMMIHKNPKRVLIIGGGDGGSARELLRHPNLEKAVMVDIDELVVNGCAEHMPSLNAGAFKDPRLELIIGDGIEYVKNAADGSFDVIVVDSTDPIPGSVGEILFTEEFYTHVMRVLAPDGVVSTQSIMPMRYDGEIYRRSIKNLQSVFAENMYIYLIPTDTYNGQTSLSLCFKGESHPTKIDKERVSKFEKEQELKYYSHKIHHAAFVLPNYLKETLGLP
jgi:spermidine synthase